MYKLQKTVDPTILIIFGATGELSRQRLIPALYRLFDHELLPKIFFVVGFARSVFSHREFRKTVRPQEIDAKTWNRFSKKIYYQPGNFTNHQDFQKLATLLPNLEGQGHNLPHRQASCANWLFYFATLPSHYETISHELKKSGLLVGCTIHKRQTRVIIEKPFGQDLESAKKLDTTLHKYFGEGQIYRIDHYLGKETVQNLLTVRFANSIFEPIWNHNFIDHVQINALEGIGVGNRGSYYEQAGALRDFVQNHMMQLLSLITMEPPSDLSTKAIRDERAKVIRAINLPSASELQDSLVIGQYQGYCKEPNVSPRSRVETFAALRLFIENSRWVKVPFYLRTGKRVDVPYKTTEISIHFKYPMQNLFGGGDVRPNVLTFTVQPKEGIYMHLMAKYPGFGIRLHPVTMELGYHSAFHGEIPEAYERLILDFLEGDQRLFARSDEIQYSWKYIDILEHYLKKMKHLPRIYRSGSAGPKEAEKLIRKDHRSWHLTQSE